MEQWPPVYDAEDLAILIRDVRKLQSQESFFDLRATRARRCQGDVIRLPADIPLIDRHGIPGTTRNDSSLWLVIGNTCDFERDLGELSWTQVVPLLDIGSTDDVEPQLLQDLSNYRVSRYFYVPDWRGQLPAKHYMAELPMPVTIDKRAVLEADLEARLSRSAWILLNACLVRFLARDDGRFAA